ncbi:MAG: hypothetical protein IH969_05610 [Candidatus Krumholzibacteriota bacterium]|nr:hypothetical protein [Candidatus Krumholzibacteriota bacterium]
MDHVEHEKLVATLAGEIDDTLGKLKPVTIGHGRNNEVPGESGYEHQIDVSAETDSALWLYECKYWSRPVTPEAVLTLAGRVSDIRANNREKRITGTIVSNLKGLSSGAKTLAKHFDIGVDCVQSEHEFALRVGSAVGISARDTGTGIANGFVKRERRGTQRPLDDGK